MVLIFLKCNSCNKRKKAELKLNGKTKTKNATRIQNSHWNQLKALQFKKIIVV